MSGWLLDTNVLSELRRPRPDARVLSFIASQRLEDLFVSTVTFAEIRFGIEAVADAVRRAELNEWLGHRVRPMFEQRVLEVSEDIMLTWRLLVEEGRKVGHTFSQPDLIIAAPALQHGLTGVTRDKGDDARSRASPTSSAARRCGPRAGSRCARRRRRTWWTTSSPRAGAQWVLSQPIPLRILLVAQPELVTPVLQVWCSA